MDRLRISRAHFPVTVLGPGRRIGLWVQGCSIGCKGCISQDTWDAEAGTDAAVSDLAEWCAQCLRAGATGLTVSGGEPFQQAASLTVLLQTLRDVTRGTNFDILVYSGYPFRVLNRRFPGLLALTDAIVSEPYMAERAGGGWLRGSSNQQIHTISKLGERRFGAPAQALEAGPSMQVAVSENGIWYIGIPRSGDMDRLEQIARQRGIELGGASWVA